jgi:hypothetical protein
MKLRTATVTGMGLGAAAYVIGSAAAYLLQNVPLVARPAYLSLKLLNLPSLYIGVHFCPQFFFNASNAQLFFYTLAINLPLAGAVGAVVGLAVWAAPRWLRS